MNRWRGDKELGVEKIEDGPGGWHLEVVIGMMRGWADEIGYLREKETTRKNP